MRRSWTAARCTLRAGSAATVSERKNPILLAHAVMAHLPHGAIYGDADDGTNELLPAPTPGDAASQD